MRSFMCNHAVPGKLQAASLVKHMDSLLEIILQEEEAGHPQTATQQ